MRRGHGTFFATPRGLTLVEVMAVLAISGLLLVGVWHLYHGSIRVYRRGLQEVHLTRAARTVLRIMTHDIQKALAAALPYGIRGMNQAGVAAQDADRLELTTAAYAVTGSDSPSVRDSHAPQRIRYVLEPVSPAGHLTLKRVVTNVAEMAAERVMPLSDRLHGLNLRYFDGQVWYDTWQHATLPQALEITTVFQNHGRDTRAYRFTTVVTTE